MPRDISRKLFALLNSDSVQPIDLIDIKPLGANETIRLTNAGEQITWNGDTYYPLNFSRGHTQEVVATDTGNEPPFSVSLQNVDLQIGSLLANANLDGAEVVVRMADRRLLSNPRDAAVLTKGEARDFQVSESVVTFSVVDAISVLEQTTVPRRIYQALCNYGFGSQSCSIDRSVSPFTVAATALTGTTVEAVVVDSSILALAGGMDPTEYWEAGDIIVASGGAVLQTRPIQRVDGPNNTFYVRYPFTVNPIGGACYVRRGCPKTLQACQQRQPGGSAFNFGGFDGVPYGKITPVTVNRPTGL